MNPPSSSSATTSRIEAQETVSVEMNPQILRNEFCLQSASNSLHVTCYGSSSSKTPLRYLEEAASLGYMLARRGHICINGAGEFGCMAAMNDGVLAGEGHVRGVIHEMFLADTGYFEINDKIERRRGSSHRVFEDAIILKKQQNNHNVDRGHIDGYNHGTDPIDTDMKKILIREIFVAGGNDLQERKKFLVNNTDAIIVLPGGPGTWDEVGIYLFLASFLYHGFSDIRIVYY